MIIKKIGIVIVRNIYRMTNKNIRIASKAKIIPGSSFGGYNAIERGTTFYGIIGRDSYIGCDSKIYAEIGKFTSVGDRVMCIFANHPINGFVSTSPVFYSTKKQNGRTFARVQLFDEVLLQKGKKVPVIIGNDVWIGSDVLIVGKVKIHDGAVVAAGSVVVDDVKPYSVVAGVPAKVVKKRFDDDTINKLLSLKWWDKGDEWIKKNAKLFVNVDSFLKHF